MSLSKNSFYAEFKSKNAFYRECLKECQQMIVEQLQQVRLAWGSKSKRVCTFCWYEYGLSFRFKVFKSCEVER